MADKSMQNCELLIQRIRSRRDELDALAQQLRTPEIQSAFDQWNYNSWCVSVAGDALVRVRLFTEQNFNYVETIGVIAVARHLHELCIWLSLFKSDRRYGLVYFDQLLDTQRRFYQDTKAQLEREVAFLAALGRKEADLHNETRRQRKDGQAQVTLARAYVSALRSVSVRVDEEASRQFSIYARDAQTNGYDFQSHLVREKAIPTVVQTLTQYRR